LLNERAGHIPRTSLIHSLMWKSCTDSARAQSYDAYEVGFFEFLTRWWLDSASTAHMWEACISLGLLPLA
jgi:hypothetical protein